jgi:hypothetical protein
MALQARFYSMDLVRNGKAAGERMAHFFKQRQIRHMPYIEIYYGCALRNLAATSDGL